MIDTLVNYHTRERWLAARAGGIGASDVSALFGLSPWASAFSLWCEKTGLAEPVERDEDWLTWGLLQEEPMAKFYELKTGRKVWTGGSPYCVARHPNLPMFSCTPDKIVFSAPDIGFESPGGLQIKSAAWFMAHDWDQGPPPHVQIQVQSEMACTGADWWSVPVNLGGRFRNFDVMRDQSMINEIEAQVVWFWDLVQSRTPPDIDGHDATTAILKRLHPQDNGESVDLPPEAVAFADEVFSARVAIAEAEKSAKNLKAGPENYLRALIGGATFGRLPDGRLLSLRTTSRTGYQVEASTYRALKLEKRP